MILDIAAKRDGQILRARTDISSSSEFAGDGMSGYVERDGGRICITVKPEAKMEFTQISLKFPITVAKDERLFFNGYQSQTLSMELRPDAVQQGVSKGFFGKNAAKHLSLDKYGDSHFTQYSEVKGELHGWSYCYVRKEGGGDQDIFRLFASVSERNGFTKFSYNDAERTMTIERDCEGFETANEFTALDFLMTKGSESEVFDTWFDVLDIETTAADPMLGYTTWFNHEDNISEKVIKSDLEKTTYLPKPPDLFIIDEGWQTIVGDWNVNREKFPNGMKAVVDMIHEKGYKAGLWLAPFVCAWNGEMVNRHPDWLAKDRDGQNINCGNAWGGFYMADIYSMGFQNFIRGVFDKIFNDWGFDMVKLDYLYGACMMPHDGKTRGEIMCDAMDFACELTVGKYMLSCAVPLMPAFGRTDFCRIGCDMGLDWDGNFLTRHSAPERPSTKNSVCDTFFRRQLDGRAFLSNPAPFLLRDNDMKLTYSQRMSIARLNGLCGSLLLVSDNGGDYDGAKKKLFTELCEIKNTLTNIKMDDNGFTLEYHYNDRDKSISFDIR